MGAIDRPREMGHFVYIWVLFGFWLNFRTELLAGRYNIVNSD